MQTTAELVTTIGRLTSKLNEASAKGFVTDNAMWLLYELETSVSDLLKLATDEFWAKHNRSAR